MAMARNMKAGDARRAGFSLMEVMVVMFITAMAAGVVLLSLPPQRPAHEEAAMRLQATMERLRDEAILTSTPQALALRGDTLFAQRFAEGVWQNRALRGGDDVLQHQAFRIRIEAPGLSENENETVRIVFQPGGGASAATIRISAAEAEFGSNVAVLHVSPLGEISRGEP